MTAGVKEISVCQPVFSSIVLADFGKIWRVMCEQIKPLELPTAETAADE